MPTTPRLSIGLPVFNGEMYLHQALESLLNQTYRDFELIIVDNASTDATGALCKEYAARDPRVRYVRQPENVGAAENFNAAYRLGQGELFKWAAHDDTLAPDFLEKCIAVLDANPDVVLAYSRVAQIDPQGNVSGSYDYPMRVSAADPLVRFQDLVLTNHFCVAVFGVIRRAVLEKTPLIAKYVGSDRVLLAELALHGRLFEVPEYLFFRRDHPDTSGRRFTMYRRLAWFDPKQKGRLYYPYWRLGAEFFLTARRAAGNFRCRAGAY
ncbi:MAG TPA: glycosyltransferase family 2 protein, partial [Anaerolineaceae bacterium]|nr:glycosyltransferase family 2 protein [Anaerolineaceae bacterium]